jgi:hypothetical protein
MTCDRIQEQLPLMAYGDLADAERAAVESHLAQCPACRGALAELDEVRRLLDAPAPVRASPIVVPSAARRRSARLWQVAAVVSLAVMLAVWLVRVEARIDGRELILRWGRPEVPPPVVETRTIVVREDPAALAGIEERIKLLNELVHAVARNHMTTDQPWREELETLRREVTALHQTYHQRLGETERDVSALYTAQFGARMPGANP